MEKVGDIDGFTLRKIHEHVVHAECGLVWGGCNVTVCAIGQYFARFDIVGKAGAEEFCFYSINQVRIFDGAKRFYTAAQISRHPIRTANVHIGISVVFKVIDAAVFQKSSDDAAHPDVVAYTGNTRTQTAYTAHNQVNLYAVLRCVIKGADDFGILK